MKNNKGFSLVELIIVIAIMAILVGVMAPQLIKYIEKTNVSSDIQTCDSIRTAIMTAALDPDVAKLPGDGLKGNATYTLSGSWGGPSCIAAAKEILGVTDFASIKTKSKAASGKTFSVIIKNSNTVTVQLTDSIKSGQ